MPMTNADFAKYVMRVARRCAEWGADCLDLPDYRDKPISQEAVDRFLKPQRELLDFIESETRDDRQSKDR